MNISAFETAVWEKEGVRIVIRANRNDGVADYDSINRAAANSTISSWLDNRVRPKINDREVTVIDGRGQIPNGKTKMSTLRNSYKVD